MLKIKTFLLTLSLIFSMGASFLPAAASAQVSQLKCGANSAATGDASGGGCASAPKDQPSLREIIAKVINVISSLVAVVSVIMIMIGGFRYVTSAGDSSRVEAAKKTITNALIGLVIAFFAQVIVRYVISQVK
jgi:hypothetical protein